VLDWVEADGDWVEWGLARGLTPMAVGCSAVAGERLRSVRSCGRRQVGVRWRRAYDRALNRKAWLRMRHDLAASALWQAYCGCCCLHFKCGGRFQDPCGSMARDW
jgi:hypothetical protein